MTMFNDKLPIPDGQPPEPKWPLRTESFDREGSLVIRDADNPEGEWIQSDLTIDLDLAQ